MSARTILLVEDEPSVRDVTRIILERAGYKVLEASNGVEALLRTHQCQDGIQVLVTDVVMPRMSGPDLAAKINARHPGVRIIYISAYEDDVILRHGVTRNCFSFLQKPFDHAELVRMVREALNDQKSDGDALIEATTS